MNNFEQVSSLGHQISLAGGKAEARVSLYSKVQCVMGICEQTDRTENITFLQLRCRAVVNEITNDCKSEVTVQCIWLIWAIYSCVIMLFVRTDGADGFLSHS